MSGFSGNIDYENKHSAPGALMRDELSVTPAKLNVKYRDILLAWARRVLTSFSASKYSPDADEMAIIFSFIHESHSNFEGDDVDFDEAGYYLMSRFQAIIACTVTKSISNAARRLLSPYIVK